MGMPAGGELTNRIGGLVGGPAREVAGAAQATHHDEAGGPGAVSGNQQAAVKQFVSNATAAALGDRPEAGCKDLRP